MNLLQKQLEIQKDSVFLINEYTKKSKSLGSLRNSLAKRISEYKKEHFLEFAKKVVKKDNFFDIFKNDTDYFYKQKLSKAYSNEFIDYIESNFLLKNNYLKDVDVDYRTYAKGFEKFKNIIFEKYFDILSKNLLKQKQQLASFYISIVSSGEIAIVLINFLLLLMDEKITRQNAADEFLDISQGVIEKSLKKVLKKEEVFYDIEEKFENLSQKIRQQVAQELIDLINDYLDEEQDEKGSFLIYANEKFKNKIDDKSLFANTVVKYKPMVVPPRDWACLNEGGFLTGENIDRRFKLWFIKTNMGIERKYVRKYSKIPKEIFDAVNRLQKTSYKINKSMIEVLDFFIPKIPQEFKKYPKSSKKVLSNLKNINSKIELEKFIAKGVMDVYEEEINRKLKYRLKDERLQNSYKKFVEKMFKYKELKHKDILLELGKIDNFLEALTKLIDEYKDYEEFFYVWMADFRGRIYTAQSVLQPQGSDLVKSFLLFSKSQKLNEEGIKWFKIHGANLYGEVDKAPYDKRIKWVDENEENILKSANDWKNEEWWQNADEPFEFLSFCFEYKRFKENPDNFETSMPVAIDGSNNGIQHISTFMRDVNAAKKVNVLPTQKVEDIYKEVANTFKRLLEEDYENFKNENYETKNINGYELAFKEVEEDVVLMENLYPKWIEFLEKHSFDELIENLTKEYGFEVNGQKKRLKELQKISKDIGFDLITILKQKYSTLTQKNKKGLFIQKEKKTVLDARSLIPYILDKVDRSFVKKPVMIDSYGAGEKSKKDKFKEILSEMLNLKEQYIYEFSRYLAKVIEKAINIEITCSDVYQEFMKDIVGKYFKNNDAKFFSWETPLGFRVLQMEFVTNDKIIKLDNHKIKVSIPIEKVNIKEHKNGIAPNYVHSLDATHLYMTLNRFDKSISVIHDSYATLPNNVRELFEILKEEFVKLYSKDVFREFVFSVLDEENIKNILKNKKYAKYEIVDLIPRINKEFPLEDVLKSKYMFS